MSTVIYHNPSCSKCRTTLSILEEKGVAYKTGDGSVFFKISEYPEYGKLANLENLFQSINQSSLLILAI